MRPEEADEQFYRDTESIAFPQLSDEQLATLESLGARRTINRGEIVYRAGQRDSSNSPPRHQPAVQLQRTKLLKPSSFWRRIVPVSFTAQNSPSTEGALRFEW
jgi:hypothetical protein